MIYRVLFIAMFFSSNLSIAGNGVTTGIVAEHTILGNQELREQLLNGVNQTFVLYSGEEDLLRKRARTGRLLDINILIEDGNVENAEDLLEETISESIEAENEAASMEIETD